jgi:hypothetical protein
MIGVAGGLGGPNIRNGFRAAARGPLAATSLPSGDARFGLPRRIPLLKVGDLVELGHRLRRQIWETEQHGLDASAAEVSRLDPGRRPMQATVKS